MEISAVLSCRLEFKILEKFRFHSVFFSELFRKSTDRWLFTKINNPHFGLVKRGGNFFRNLTKKVVRKGNNSTAMSAFNLKRSA